MADRLTKYAHGKMLKKITRVRVCMMMVVMLFPCPNIKVPRKMVKKPKNSTNQARMVIWMVTRFMWHLLFFVPSLKFLASFTMLSWCSLKLKKIKKVIWCARKNACLIMSRSLHIWYVPVDMIQCPEIDYPFRNISTQYQEGNGWGNAKKPFQQCQDLTEGKVDLVTFIFPSTAEGETGGGLFITVKRAKVPLSNAGCWIFN